MSYTFQIESRPSGRISVTVHGEIEYPDAASDLANRARDLHREALRDLAEVWGVEVESDDIPE